MMDEEILGELRNIVQVLKGIANLLRSIESRLDLIASSPPLVWGGRGG